MIFDKITLPSLGLFYPDNRSVLSLKSLNGNDEILLTTPSICGTKESIKILLNTIIIEKDIDVDKLLNCDKNAILLFTRSVNYGDKINSKIKCPHCNKEDEFSFNLSDIEIKDLYEIPDENGCFTFILPNLKINKELVEIKFKPLTVEMANKVELEIYKNPSNKKRQSIIKIKNQIVSINGNSDCNYIEKIIKGMPILDFSALKDYIDKVEPGFNENINFECPNCKNSFKEKLTIDDSFLGITIDYRQNIMNECFICYYYSKGGISRPDAYSLSVPERRWEINRITEEMEKKAKAEEDAVNKAKTRK